MNYYLERSKETQNFSYPNNFKPNVKISELLNLITNNIIEVGQIDKQNVYKIAGRVVLKRKYGKLYFYTMKKDNIKFQILCNAKEYLSDDFKAINNTIQMGDIIGAEGYISKSNTGEPSLVPIKLLLLTPCLHPIPKSFESQNTNSNNGKIVDVDVRYRKRYLDMIINDETMNIFIKRGKIIKFVRNYLDSLGFLEVETPILHQSYGGANAKPFVTYHNDLKQEMFMRIAPELNLKQLAIGGMDKIYEIGKQFRNEQNDATHLCEFLSLELYQNYANYTDMITLTENLMSELVKNINGDYPLKYNNETIDFTPPFNKIDITQKLSEFGVNLDLLQSNNETDITQYLQQKCVELKVKCHPMTIPKMLDKIIGHFLEPLCKNPTFLMNHPSTMSPLSRRCDSNTHIAERFELFISGMEYANAYSELNDPKIQKSNFENQLKDKSNGDDEAQIPDLDFVTALEYGLPPCAGLGIGLERLIMLLTNCLNIKEVSTFPPVR